ncbi:MAG: allophanate hydrolase, partial [Notoacmeibacter sp.]|nr:allophanate hydrolase [Notoacmeibacter sp.]
MNPNAQPFAFWRSMTPVKAVQAAYAAMQRHDDPAMFISVKPQAVALAEAEALMRDGQEGKPLFGLPFVVKDNIDVAGMETSCACPAYTRMATRSAFVVARLEAAGAICIAKANLDQFATGLVGVRSPYGIARNSMRADLVPGGSSSGSATSVGAGIAAFSLGTDTAGSGRIPAGLNAIAGLKPSLGLLSATGMVPACRSLDTISVFAPTIADAAEAAAVAQGHDDADFMSRALPPAGLACVPPRFKVGVPAPDKRFFFGDSSAEAAYAADLDRLATFGAEIIEIDFEPLHEVARLLYEGPWVAERYHAVKALIESDPEALHPVTRGIISGATKHDAVAAFDAFYRLATLKRAVQPMLNSVDCLAVPTLPALYTVEQVLADPVTLNSNLGTYTNFVNLLDLAAVSVPCGMRPDGFPSSLTFISKAGRDALLAGIGHLAETGERHPGTVDPDNGRVTLAVV